MAALPLEIDVLSVKRKLDAGEEFLFVDCREPDEAEIARIAAATLIPMTQLESRLGELEPHREHPIVVHCHHGGRSMRVTNWLRQQGFPHVQSMAGGIDEWAEKIEPGMARY